MTTQPHSVPQLSGRTLLALRVIWVCVVVFYLAGMLYGVPLLLQQYASLTGFALTIGFTTWSSEGLRLALDSLGISVTAYSLMRLISEFSVTLSFVGMSILLFLRRSHEQIGWFTSFFLATFGIAFNSAWGALTVAYPNLSVPFGFIAGMPWLLFYVFFYVFPDGRFVPRWTRWLTLLLVVFVAFLILLPTIEVLFPIFLIVAFSSAVFAQVYRYRRVSTPMERAQTRWVMYTVAIIAFIELFGQGVLRLVFPQFVVEGTTRLVYELWLIALTPVFALLPLSLTIAILRYRLWDIDIIIRRTLIYGVLTILLTAIYFGSVVVLQQVFAPLFGTSDQITIVASTLAIAALFQPLRRRIQATIDRRFYRRKYDAQQTLQALSQKMRDETDLDQLTSDLAVMVKDTLQPEHVSLWLKDARHAEEGRT